ncbi:hypothetical protein [Geodermatophilus amargosae]|uniref:hypothetical protein n=1 Tax=Geodermatophilus amargosae TaxID=1296565 RepID=UPI0034DF1730
MRIRYTASLMTTAAALTLTACGSSGAETPEAAMQGYMDAGLAGDFETACSYLDETWAHVWDYWGASSCEAAMAEEWDAETVRDNRHFQVVTDSFVAVDDHLISLEGFPVLIARDDPGDYDDGFSGSSVNWIEAFRETPEGWKLTAKDELS